MIYDLSLNTFIKREKHILLVIIFLSLVFIILNTKLKDLLFK
jgi:hypothetical protein